ncbi:protein SOGA3a [Chanos chanos]|uniref:Protein SOGA3a n=1 Tax=Chanos chanos TaxID=29144 RepID=A0A6J2WBD0_CHACN|nr:uncharacterized protein KIAA0408 homolog [Chanos chanos]
MWNAFGSGSGLHGGAGGYVSKAQGWEFIPCSRLERERGRGNNRSPHRTLSSPASVSLGHFYERPLPGVGAAQSSQHSRLKKKIEDLKKRHEQDKEEWMREKELLLRQVADIQGGENRRILLDLKSVLDEVQLEVKREEAKRGELQLQYTKDRCAWELERAELKCRIAQLEAKGHSSVLESVRGLESGDTLRREREEQKRLLADTHTAAMDLRCRLESNERDWMREKSELLERFDSERKAWENQLRHMQQKVEELCHEVRARREGGDIGANVETSGCALRLSLHSASTVSSALTDPSEARSSSYSELLTQPSNDSIDSPGRHSRSGNEPYDPCCSVQSKPADHHSTGKCDPVQQQAIDTGELEDILFECLGKRLDSEQGAGPSIGQENLLDPFRGFQSMEIKCGSDKKKNTTALNAALQEIARVSEELCSYHDEIRKKSEIKRSHTESLFFPGGVEMVDNLKSKSDTGNTGYNLNDWCKDLEALDEQSWITWEGISKEPNVLENEAKAPLKKRPAPPVPPRSTSWYMSSPPPPESELNVLESFAERRCHGACIHLERKCNSPSVVRKFEAMLQENEGKILTDSGIVSCTVPADSKCNISCCQTRWSCDGSRFGSSKSSTYVPVQKCLSDVNILATGLENSSDNREGENKKSFLGLPQQIDPDFPRKALTVELTSSSPNILASFTNTITPRRNEMLEKKTAEFNRTLFQAEMGRGIHDDGLNSTDTSANHGLDCAPRYLEVKSTDTDSDLVLQYPERNMADALCDLMAECPEGESKATGSHTVPQLESKPKEPSFELPLLCQDIKEGEIPLDLPTQYPVNRLKEFTSQTPTSFYPSIHVQKQETKPPSTEHILSTLSQLAPSVSVSQTDGTSPTRARPQVEKIGKAKAVVSDQPPAEAKTKQPGRPKQDTPNIKSRVLEDNPWKPLTLAAYPRPVESRSNYGAIERILKSYEDSSRSHQQLQPSQGTEEDLKELLDMLDNQQQSKSNQKPLHTQHPQAATHKETHVTVKQRKESAVSVKKTFSRPACPAKRRLPSRWASRSPSSSSTSSSTSSSPITHPLVSTQKQTFSYSAFHTETAIL